MRRCALALLLLAAVSGESAAAPRARGGLPPGLAEAAASLERHAPGALLRLPLDGGDRPLGAMAGPDGARAVLRYRGEREARGPRTTALTLPPGGVHLAPAATWSWASGERGSLEIEVYRGDLAAFRVVGGEAVPAEVVRPGGFWSVYGPGHLRWGLLLWMAALAAGVLVLARRYFRLPVTAAWGLLLVAVALLPVAPALSSARVYGPFDAKVHAPIWRGPPGGPPFRAETARMGDVVNHLVPRQIEARRQLLAGQAPLLTQRTGGGQALLGNGQTAPLALLSIASLPFEAPVAQALRAFLKVLLALLGTFVAARLLGARAGFALAAALGFAFCGSMSVWKLQPHTEVMAFWPWVHVAAERLIRDPRRSRPAVLAGAALTGLLLAGHPETAAMGLGAVGVRWIWQCGFGGWRPVRPGLVRFLAAAIVAAGLSAIAVLPLAETVTVSMKLAHNRTGGPGWLDGHPGLPVAKAVHLAAAGVLGSWKDGTYRGLGSYVLVSEGAVGLALVALAFAALPLLYWRRPRESYLPLVAAGGVALHLLLPGVGRLWAALPGIAHVSPRYAAYVAGFALALLGALGLERLVAGASSPGRRRAALGLGLGAGAALAAVPLVARAAAGLDGVPPWAARLAVVSWPAAAWVCAAAALPLLAVLARRLPALVAVTAPVLVAGQLATAYLDYVPTVHADLAYAPVPLTQALEAAEGRVIGTGGVLLPNLPAAHGLDDVRAHDQTTWSRYDRWLAEVLGARRTRQIARYPRVAPDHRAPLSAMAVRHALTSGPERLPPPWRPLGSYGAVRVWELPGAQGWAFFAREAVGVGSVEETFARSRGDRPADALVPVEDERLLPGARAGGRASVVQVAREDERVRVWVTVLEDSWLVVSQTAIPGWRASIDGRPLPLGRAYGVLAAVPVPAGARLVELRYRPWGWLVGAPLSGATALLLAGGFGYRLVRRRRSATAKAADAQPPDGQGRSNVGER